MDLDDGWPEDAVITRHPNYDKDHIAFVRSIKREEGGKREKAERGEKTKEVKKKRTKEMEKKEK